MSSYASMVLGGIEDLKSDLVFHDAPQHPQCAAIFDYWDGKRGGRPAPDRRDIRPAEIARLLPHLTIMEAVDGGRDFRIRLFGTALVEITHEERTGKLLSEIAEVPAFVTAPASVRHRWMHVTRHTYRTAAPTFVSATLASSGRPFILVHGIALPLTAGGTEIAQIMAGFFVAPAEGEG